MILTPGASMDFRMLSKVLLRFFVLFLQITVVKWETSKESKKHLINAKENRKKKRRNDYGIYEKA